MTPNFSGQIRFCPHCGGPAAEREAFGRLRPYCPSCNLTFFQDPKLAVAVLVDQGGRLLLQQRAINPGRGRWSFPSGYVERGERVEDAAMREVWEETGLEARITELLGIYSHDGNPVVLVVYLAEADERQLIASDESLALASFDPDALPELAFPHDHAIIQDWLERRNRPSMR